MDDALLMGIGESASQLCDKAAGLLQIEVAAGETLGQGAASKPQRHEIGASGITPVIEQ
jgi:hypothetical protein